MRRRRKQPNEVGPKPAVNVPKELLDQLVKGPMTQGDLESMFRELKKAVIERAMSAEMNEHPGYRQGESKPEGQGNQRNGTSGKPSSPTRGRYASRCRETETARSSRRSSASTSGASPASTRRSSLCMPAA